MFRKICLLFPVVLAVTPAFGQIWPWAPSFSGQWVVWTELGQGARTPSLMTMHSDGAVIMSDLAMFGGAAHNPYRITPLHGAWDRSGKKKVTGTSLFMVFNPIVDPQDPTQLNNLIGFGRARTVFEVKTPDRMEGIIWLDFLPCPSPLFCPNPLDPSAGWVPYPTLPAIVPIPIAAERIKGVEPPLLP